VLARGRGGGSCVCFCSDLIIKGNSGNQVHWEWWFCLIKNGKTEQLEPFLLAPPEAPPLAQELC
jgi:hypothetical protein